MALCSCVYYLGFLLWMQYHLYLSKDINYKVSVGSLLFYHFVCLLFVLVCFFICSASTFYNMAFLKCQLFLRCQIIIKNEPQAGPVCVFFLSHLLAWLRQGHGKFKVHMGNLVRLCLNK